ncbi:MAG: GNAT family N-acetyltransferase [Lachnospiraceae bacterium]|nr:GNAT family N-acetyltransferase [Lachnospiraceae bacterium]
MENLMIRRQSLDEMKEIYDGMMTRHFPADEIKPFWKIKDSYEKGEYMGYGLYEENSGCLAYAWMCSIPDENWILLDYYAVTENLRGQGMGSRFLKRFFEECTEGVPVIIEVEDPDRLVGIPEDEKERELAKRLRRISFYLKNGVKETNLRASVFQVPYSIMVYMTEDAQAKGNGPAAEDAQSRENAQKGVRFDEESLKRAYHYFYSHVQGNVEIGDMHEIEHS